VVNGAVVAGADQGVYVDLAQFGRQVVGIGPSCNT